MHIACNISPIPNIYIINIHSTHLYYVHTTFILIVINRCPALLATHNVTFFSFIIKCKNLEINFVHTKTEDLP